MSKKRTVEEEHVINDLETLKVISDPLRIQILQFIGLGAAADSPTTVKQLSEHLDIPPTKLYYHVNLLEKHNLISVAETRLVSGIVEKHYLPSAKRYRVELSAEGDDDAAQHILRGAIPTTISSIFNNALSNIEKSQRFRRRKRKSKEPDGEKIEGLLQQCLMQLSPAEAQEFRTQFEALAGKFRAKESPEGQVFGLTIAFMPYYHLNQDDSKETS